MYNERVTQSGSARRQELQGRRLRFKAMVDVFNAFNINTITNVNNTYGTTGASWLVPTAISLARLVKIGAQIDF